jgi:predicted PurR-regulated permease PerM
MKKDEFKDKIFLVTYGIILFVLLMNYQWVFDLFGVVVKALLPFIVGLVIAFILNVLMKMIEEKMLYKLNNGKRALSLVLSLIAVFGFIVVLLFILIPQVKNAGMIFLDNIPEYHENILELGEKVGLSEEQLSIIKLEDTKFMKEMSNILKNNSKFILDLSFGLVNSVVSVVCNFFVGLIFAIYVLIDKESLCRQLKKLFNKLFNKKVYNKILEISELSNITFTNFVKVQFLEACILGGLCFLGMLLLGLPYAATISVVIGFTALIPIFGAFIGCVIGAFLIFMINPLQALIFIAFFLILQQIEGNLIYPKVVGGKIGLPSIWVLVAVMIGGSVGGIFGMLMGVPIISVLYSLIKSYVNNDKVIKETK